MGKGIGGSRRVVMRAGLVVVIGASILIRVLGVVARFMGVRIIRDRPLGGK
jgi:hypothetical protein